MMRTIHRKLILFVTLSSLNQNIRIVMIHGSKRNKKEKTQQEMKDEDELSQKINSKLAEFFSINRDEVNPQQIAKLLEFTSLIMQLCSDIPTIFNFRRQLIEKSIQGREPEQIAKALNGQIKLTTKLIQSDPKSYTIWSYRQWLVIALFKINSAIIKAEKELCKMLLMKDEKNFHVWNYRNWLNSIQLFIDEEITFTEEKIKSNPFNFSPYHFRTKLICQKYSKMLNTQIDDSLRKEIISFGMPKELLDSQFESVKTALFLNPNEEAPWIYYNWLLSQLVPAFIAAETLEESHKIVYLNMKVSDFSALINQQATVKGNSGKMNSDVWTITLPSELKVQSNLEKYHQIKLQTNGRLFLGNEINKQWIEENIKEIFKRQLQFLDEILESEDGKCRFASLQKGYIYKLLLQCGTTTSEFAEIVGKGLASLKQIEKQPKGHKYVLKQIEFWERLSRGELTVVEAGLKSKFD